MSRRPLPVLLALAVALLVCACAAAAGAAIAAPVPAPPTPVVSAGHARMHAARGSTCWQDASGDGGCADVGAAPRTRRALRVRAARWVHVDLGVPARSLVIEDLAGRRFAQARPARRSGGLARHWSFRVPAGARGAHDLLLFARYPQGDGAFGVRLAVRRAR